MLELKVSPDSIAQVWVVNKFSEGKTVTSLEVFDKDDNHIIQFMVRKLNYRFKVFLTMSFIS